LQTLNNFFTHVNITAGGQFFASPGSFDIPDMSEIIAGTRILHHSSLYIYFKS